MKKNKYKEKLCLNYVLGNCEINVFMQRRACINARLDDSGGKEFNLNDF